MATVNTIATTLPIAPQQNSFLSDEAKRRLLAAQLLQRQGADASAPVYTTGHGLAKLGAGLAGGLMEGLTEAREAELNKENAALIGQLHDITEPPTSLTDAQIEALRCIANGDRHAAAAARLGISESALKARLAAARTALLARTTTEAIQRARDYRLL